MQHYHRTRRKALMGDDVASPAVVENKAADDDTPILDEPLVKAAITGAGVYHGYKRTGSVAWALIYGLLARLAPVPTGAVVIAQGFGKPKGS